MGGNPAKPSYELCLLFTTKDVERFPFACEPAGLLHSHPRPQLQLAYQSLNCLVINDVARLTKSKCHAAVLVHAFMALEDSPGGSVQVCAVVQTKKTHDLRGVERTESVIAYCSLAVRAVIG